MNDLLFQKELSNLKENDFKLAFALDCAESINWELTPDFKKIIFSENFDRMYGIKQADYDYDFEAFVDLHLESHKNQIYDCINKYLKGETDMMSVEISMLDSKGKLHWLHVRGKFINEERRLVYGVSVNITERKNYEQRLAQMAYKDIKTGLYKQEYITDVLAGRVKDVKLTNTGLMMLNISKFSDINAVFGHERGDTVLIHVAEMLTKITNEYSNLLAKIEASGFIIVFNDLTDAAKLFEIALLIINQFESPVIISGQSFYIKFKIGIAVSDGNDFDFPSLMKDAELAVNHLKNDEVNNVCVISDEIRKTAEDNLNTVYELRQATGKNEFMLLFQPIINCKTKKISGAEALIRWNHPSRGIISPAVFIPLAEQNGLINQIGDFVLREALLVLKKFLKKDKNFYISINVSVIQLMSSDFTKNMRDLIKLHSLPPGNIVVEVTESVFITDMDRIIKTLSELREIGVRISLDDFGTGYSSLNYIKKIPLDNLKIDQSFLQDVLNNPTSEAILKSIIILAHNLDLSITAEGVETSGHIKLLEENVCDYLQGYYFSKPIPADELEAFG